MRPLVLAHRGASAYAPENTLAAFRLARELGADGIEFDVQLTADKIPIVIHDDTVERTTDGQGFCCDFTVAELRQLDAGAWKTEDYRGESIPTLAQVFQTFKDWLKPAGNAAPCLMNVELKTDRLTTDGLERVVLNLIAREGVEDRILISSFNPLTLGRAKKINPRLKRGLLYDSSQAFYLRRAWFRYWVSPTTLHPHHTMIDAAYMKWAAQHKWGVVAWTVDDPDQAKRLADLGVNAIITNKPDVIREALN